MPGPSGGNANSAISAMPTQSRTQTGGSTEAAAEPPSLRTCAVRSPRVLVVSGSVGGGHDGAAAELTARLTECGLVAERRDYLDAIPWFARHVLREGYTVSVLYLPPFFEWLFRSIDRSPIVQWLSLRFCRLGTREVARWLAEGDYDVVVSTYPLVSQTLGRLKRLGRTRLPLVTYLTDPAVHRLWVHEHVDHHLTVTPPTATQGTRVYGLPMQSAGPLVPARFTRRLDERTRLALRAEIGLPPSQPVALIVTGSLGLGDVMQSVEAVLATGLATPLVLCGRNERLRRRLRGRAGVVALGWRTDVPELMQVSDVLIHNAGGLSFTEALVAGLPAISYACLPGHGRANAGILAESGIAPWARTRQELTQALQDKLAGAVWPRPLAVLPSVHEDASEFVATLAKEHYRCNAATR